MNFGVDVELDPTRELHSIQNKQTAGNSRTVVCMSHNQLPDYGSNLERISIEQRPDKQDSKLLMIKLRAIMNIKLWVTLLRALRVGTRLGINGTS